MGETRLLDEAVRLGHASDALERLRELASTTTGLLVPVFAAHADALVRNDFAGLENVAARFEEAGFMLLAAEAVAASGSRGLYGRLVSFCEGARTPALVRITAAPLACREREIAVRTVDNHLSNAYAKLGITTRGDLALVLSDDNG
ncbi:hypothetical protein SK803_28105 [Lentzea sp. BCCO 10_0856]|uniref:HTH luxR-type domain-containing protein n=1 Tax=Lentzea miocenica TaxID=3095431 RepID=A0ABU4T7E9_9PSEU|nr:hypothetical protein [Lentzea sp. BCCO 10_0856]MDX8034099.1 hypothetical protein [Lentzea sp. BCCO 10_0856]